MTNQHFVVESQAIEAVKQIIPGPTKGRPDRGCPEQVIIRLKGLAVKLLAACLEGRDDIVCHEILADKVRSANKAYAVLTRDHYIANQHQHDPLKFLHHAVRADRACDVGVVSVASHSDLLS